QNALRLVLPATQPHALEARLALQLRDRFLHGRRHFDDVRVRLLVDLGLTRVHAVHAIEELALGEIVGDGRDVPEPDSGPADRQALDLLDRGELPFRAHLEAGAAELDLAGRIVLIAPAQRLADHRDADALRPHAVLIELDGDLARFEALEIDLGHSGHLEERRADPALDELREARGIAVPRARCAQHRLLVRREAPQVDPLHVGGKLPAY